MCNIHIMFSEELLDYNLDVDAFVNDNDIDIIANIGLVNNDLYDISNNEIIELIETVMYLIDTITSPLDWLRVDLPNYITSLKNDIFELLSVRDFNTEEYINNNTSIIAPTTIICNETLMTAINVGIELYKETKLFETNTCKIDSNNVCENDNSKSYVSIRIDELRLIPQPAQRTREWYIFRSLLLTASNLYKVFGSQAAQNQLIYEKCTQFNTPFCEPEIDGIPRSVNVDTAMHWGQKYEPMSVFLYEHLTDATIEEFGCIRHDKYDCIGASPDGINVNPNSSSYGRMIEIKNVKTRVINGVPKKEYWVQMQIQMEVCNLEECDFLETKFIEYENVSDFIEDSDENDKNVFKSKHEGKQKGMVIYFTKPDGIPFYVFNPLTHTTMEELREWAINEVEQYTSDSYNYTYIMKNYWKLEVYSCVLVKRDRKWFNDGLQQILNLWETIEKERVGDYSHRAPKKRVLNTNLKTQTKLDLKTTKEASETAENNKVLFELFKCKMNNSA
jgi:putative phage-type endonuclease